MPSFNFTPESLFAGAVASFLVLLILVVVILKFKGRIKPKKFRKEWRRMQNLLSRQENWQRALIEADDLLDIALKKNKKVKGSNMGARMLSAEKIFTKKDEVWYGHKLRRACEKNPKLKLDKKAVRRALIGIRQGLKDLGAV